MLLNVILHMVLVVGSFRRSKTMQFVEFAAGVASREPWIQIKFARE
jgi:hypothetical protein